MNSVIRIVAIFLIYCVIVEGKKFKIVNRNQISCKKDGDLKISKENFILCLSRLLIAESKKEDKEMMEEIAKRFVEQKNVEREKYSEGQIEDYVRNEVEDFVEKWKDNMYTELIRMLEVEYDHQFLEEMKKDPDFYGLTYDAYRILNFKFEDN